MRAQLSDAVSDYLSLRRSQDYSKESLNSVQNVLRRFLAVNGNIWCHSITEEHVIRHFEEAGRKRSPNSLRHDHTYLNQFFRWMRQTKRMPQDTNPMANRRRPVMRKRERDRLHVSQFPALLDAAESIDPRNRAAVAVLLYTLIRDSEAGNIRLADVDLEGGWLRVKVSKSYTEDRMPICAELDAELRRWLSTYSASVTRPLQPYDYLLPCRHSGGFDRGEDGRITTHAMDYLPNKGVKRLGAVVKASLEALGFPTVDELGNSKMEGSHTIRRSGARALFDRLAADGYDHALRIVQSMLHHGSISVTEGYIGVTADRRSRDEILKGTAMYPHSDENVIRLTV